MDIPAPTAPEIATVTVTTAKKIDTPRVKTEVEAAEMRRAITDMSKDGFTPSEIAEALGYPANTIDAMLAQTVEIGSPEQILQEALRTVVTLIPVADTVYRSATNNYNATSLTSFIDTARNLIQDLYAMQAKEVLYRDVVQRALQPFCRRMIKEMMVEVRNQSGAFDGETFATNLGIKFQEAYRKTTEDLATVLGISSDEKARVLAGISVKND